MWCSWSAGCPGTPPTPPRAPQLGLYGSMHVGQMSLIPSIPSPCKAQEGSGREPGQCVIPPSRSQGQSLAQASPSAPAEPPAPRNSPPCRVQPQQGLWQLLLPDRRQQRDAAAKHPSSFASPSPSQPQPRAQRLWGSRFPLCGVGPRCCRICASSPLLYPCILLIAAAGCSPPFLALFFLASPCAAGWEWYGPPSSARCVSVDVARR